MITETSNNPATRLGHEFKGEPRWSTLTLPLFVPREGSRTLTPFGWFTALALGAIATGAALGFAI